MSKRELLDPHVVKLHQKPPSYHRRLRPLLYEVFPFSVFLPLLHTGLEPNPCIIFICYLAVFLPHPRSFVWVQWWPIALAHTITKAFERGVHPCILYGLLLYDI